MGIVLRRDLASQLEKHGLILGEYVQLGQPVIFNGPARIYDNVVFEQSSIDAFSSVGSNSVINTTTIGRYTTIGHNAVIGTSSKVTNLLINSPSVFANNIFTRISGIVPDQIPTYGNRKITTFPVKIGHDVTIGSNVTIVGERTIGNGAVIESNSYVVEDVPAYAIVRGNPGVIIGYRFDQELIERIEKVQVWRYNLPLATSQRIKFYIDEIEQFVKIAEDIKYDLKMPLIEEKYRQIKIIADDSCDLLKCTKDTLPYSLELNPEKINLD